MLKMKATFETEAFIGGEGYLVITQKDYPEEDSNILLSYEQAILVAEYIMQNKDDLKCAWNDSKDE